MKKSYLLLIFFISTLQAQIDTLWTRTFGGSGNDLSTSFQVTDDGGYIIAGYTHSFGNGQSDGWLIKTDSEGNEERNNTFGGEYWDEIYSVQQATDGGYIFTGLTGNYTDYDLWLVKVNSNLDTVWTKTLGSSGTDYGESVQLTDDGGYIITGTNNGEVWIIKTDSEGNEEWNQAYGGVQGLSIQKTTDSGYIIAGYSHSFGSDQSDVLLMKTDSEGNEVWNQTFGGEGFDGGKSVQQSINGGYIITGITESFNSGSFDVWIIKTDSNGDSLWTKTFGGSEIDYGESVQLTDDGGYIITGSTESFGSGSFDVWIIKTDSNGDSLWTKTFGGVNDDRSHSIQQTLDGGYIITGNTMSYGNGGVDVWLLKGGPYPGLTWHVSTTGSDEIGDGSVNNPFATIQQGIDNASHGDTVLVSPGLYCGSVDFIGKNIVVGSHFLIDSNDVHIDSTILGPGDPYDYSSDCGYYFGGVNFVSGEDSTAQFIGFTISGTWGSPSIKCIGSNPSISYLNIENNTVTSQGVLEIIDSHPSLDYLNLLNNKKSSSGHMGGNNGAAMSINNSNVSLSNSLIVNNISIYEDNFYGTTDTLGGGIIVVNNSILMQNNNTFFGNSGSTDYASAIHIYDSSSSTIKNSIFWNDSVHEQIIGSANITYSNVYGGWDGEGNINMDPLFCNPDSNDFRLAENSPVVEIGENGLTIGALGIGCEAIILAINNKVIPKHYSLYQNYPNPFNPITSLRYDLPEDGLVNITIYDMMGRIVKTLVNNSQTAGYKSVQWNATNDRNEPVSAGLYLYTIQAGEFRQTKKMVLLK